MTEAEREELIEKMANAIFASTYSNGRYTLANMARAALAVAEPVIREQADNALREENARLREALQPFVDRLAVLEETILHKYAIETRIDVEHLRAARAAIREGGNK